VASKAKAKPHPAHQYALDVNAGRLLCNRLIKLACRRYTNDLKTGKKRGLYFDKAAAQHALDFFGFLRHSKGEWAGEPFVLSPWQQFIVYNLFGWMRQDGTRRFRIAYDEVPRKNGKTTLAAGIELYLFFADGEPGAEVYTAATKRDQARIAHSEAERMVTASPALSKRIGIVRDNMHVIGTASKCEPLGADADTMDGLNVHGAVMDELHAHKNRKMYDVMETATGSRRQPLIFIITTAGHDRHSICWELHDYGIKILEGVIEDDTFFVFIAGVDEDDDWTDPKIWEKANPNWGISCKPDDVARLAKKAMEMPAAQNAFRRLRLDEWTEQEVRWLNIIDWDKCDKPVEPRELLGRECWGGLDLSTKIDLTALVLLFPPLDEDDDYKVIWRFFIPGDNVQQRVKRDRVPYDVWIKQGFIIATDGNVIDYEYIRNEIAELSQSYAIQEIGFDPWNATQTALQLQDDGFNMVEMRQGIRTMAEPTKELEALVKSRRFSHGGNPVARWNASNVTVRTDANENYMPDKSKSTERIDGIVAALIALGRVIVNVDPSSVYNKRGLFTLGG
jgi:phage terminase large subunit-like protein